MFLLAIAEALARGKRQLWGHPTGFIEKNPAASWTLGCVRSGGGRGVEAAWPSGEGVRNPEFAGSSPALLSVDPSSNPSATLVNSQLDCLRNIRHLISLALNRLIWGVVN